MDELKTDIEISHRLTMRLSADGKYHEEWAYESLERDRIENLDFWLLSSQGLIMLLRGASIRTQEMDEADIAQRCINSENEIT